MSPNKIQLLLKPKFSSLRLDGSSLTQVVLWKKSMTVSVRTRQLSKPIYSPLWSILMLEICEPRTTSSNRHLLKISASVTTLFSCSWSLRLKLNRRIGRRPRKLWSTFTNCLQFRTQIVANKKRLQGKTEPILALNLEWKSALASFWILSMSIVSSRSSTKQRKSWLEQLVNSPILLRKSRLCWHSQIWRWKWATLKEHSTCLRRSTPRIVALFRLRRSKLKFTSMSLRIAIITLDAILKSLMLKVVLKISN